MLTVKPGSTVKVSVDIVSGPDSACGSGGFAVSMSYATADILVDGKPADVDSLFQGAAGLYGYVPPVPDPLDGWGVLLTGGHHDVEFHIDENAPVGCVVSRDYSSGPFGGPSLVGPWIDLSGPLDMRLGPQLGLASWSTLVPFGVGVTFDGTFVVNSVGDEDDADLSDGKCDVDLKTPGDQCTLRAAIQQANKTAVNEQIVFNIPGYGSTVPEIAVLGRPLPDVTRPVVIDGSTQPGAARVVLHAANSIGLSTDGLVVSGGYSTIRGLAVGRFTGHGIHLKGGGSSTIENMYIGVDGSGYASADPHSSMANACAGIFVDGSHNNTIGGATADRLNIITNNGYGVRIVGGNGNVIAGNRIGFDAGDTSVPGNTQNLCLGQTFHAGISLEGASNNTIGGAGQGNVIAGNVRFDLGAPEDYEILIRPLGAQKSVGNVVAGNRIGYVAPATRQELARFLNPFRQQNPTLIMVEGNGNVIGGSADGAGNVIQGAVAQAIEVGAGSTRNVIQGNEISHAALGIVIRGNQTRIGGAADGEGNVLSVAAAGVVVSQVGTVPFDVSRNSILRNNVIPQSNLPSHVPIVLQYLAAEFPGSVNGVAGREGDAVLLATPNNSAQSPKISSASVDDGSKQIRVVGAIHSMAPHSYRVEFFSSKGCSLVLPRGFAEQFIGAASIDGSRPSSLPSSGGNMTYEPGRTPIDVQLPNPGTGGRVHAGAFVSATATDEDGNTSEVSNCVRVEGPIDSDGDGVSDAVESAAPAWLSVKLGGVAQMDPLRVVGVDHRGWFNAALLPDSNTRFDLAASAPFVDVTNYTSAATWWLTTIANSPYDARDAVPPAGKVVTVLTPPEAPYNTFRAFGATLDNPWPHWFEFLFDGRTGAELSGDRVVLHLVDGERGDSSLTADGKLQFVGGPAIKGGVDPVTGPASGGTPVVIRGAGFKDGAEVFFGERRASAVSVIDSATIRATTPALPEGLVDVTVVNADGGVLTLPLGFAYGSVARLVVTFAGTGAGTVSSNPSGVSCTTSCQAQVAAGLAVTLSATPAGGSRFIGWSGDGACASGSFRMAGPLACTATFEGDLRTLNVGVTGRGRVWSSFGGIRGCAGSCSAQFATFERPVLTAVPDPGWAFSGWTGDGFCGGVGGVPMTTLRNCTATFAQATATLNVSTVGSGRGYVTSSPAAIDCADRGGVSGAHPTCGAVFAKDTVVTLTAMPDPGAVFVGWGGPAACSSGTVSLKDAVACVAIFDGTSASTTQQLVGIRKIGSGNGTVASVPDGLDCGATCAKLFSNGKTIVLTATPLPGSTFAGWSGDCQTSLNGAGIITATSTSTCTARFVRKTGSAHLDFDGAGLGDVLTINPATGAWSAWTSESTGFGAGASGTWSTGWSVQPASFVLDGRTDLFLFRAADGSWARAINAGVGTFSTVTGQWTPSPGWMTIVVDLNGDRRSDVLRYNRVTGAWIACLPTERDFTYRSGTWSPGLSVYAADWNADAFGDLLLYDAATGAWTRALNDGAGGFTYATGTWAPGLDVFVGDFTGSLMSSVLLYSPTTGGWMLATVSGASFVTTSGQWDASRTVVPADLGGDGILDAVLYDSATGGVFIAYNNESISAGRTFSYYGGAPDANWGAGAQVLASDFNGDGKADFLAYVPVTGKWRQALSVSAGTFIETTGTWDPGLFIVGAPMALQAESDATGSVASPDSSSAVTSSSDAAIANLSAAAVFRFTDSDGAGPSGRLMQARDGWFYGMAPSGAAGNGTIFQLVGKNSLRVLHTFDGSANDPPAGELAQGSDGAFYGTTAGDLLSSTVLGTVFMITPDGTYTVLHSFAGNTDGAHPEGGLILGTDGAFYGTTREGGRLNFGTVFRITADGTVAILHAFAGGSDGAYPQAGLLPAADGNLYGTTLAGGATGFGTVFKTTSDGVLTVIRSFAGTDGAYPFASLIQARDGLLYGTTAGDGVSTNGTAFKMALDGTMTVLHTFAGSSEGAEPRAGVVQGIDGSFYGTTWLGGTSAAQNNGTLFRITPAGSLSAAHAFTGSSRNADGAYPTGSLTLGSDGKLYGTTTQGGGMGGANGFGVIFSLDVTSHPADTNGDGRLSIAEVTAYGAAWKKGDIWPNAPNPIPIDYVTRAGFLWRSGEVYQQVAGECPACWVAVALLPAPDALAPFNALAPSPVVSIKPSGPPR